MFYVNEVSFDQWLIHWQQVPKANLLQSWEYGSAKELAENWKVLRFMVSDSSGNPVALAQILTRSVPILGGIARLNRGPLLLNEFREDQKIERALNVIWAILREARRRRWWVVQIAPELPGTDKVFARLKQMGLRKQPNMVCSSGLVDLGVDENSLLMSLDGKWRNVLRKGQKLGVEVKHIDAANLVQNLLISGYREFQRSKGFEGLSESLLRNLAKQHGKEWQFDLFISLAPQEPDSNEPIGILATIRHGDTATYLIGFTNDQGRQMQANSVMLWNSILHAKHNSCKWFDIGGLGPTTPNGIAKFKRGLNAEPYALAGDFRGYLLPLKFFKTTTSVL